MSEIREPVKLEIVNGRAAKKRLWACRNMLIRFQLAGVIWEVPVRKKIMQNIFSKLANIDFGIMQDDLDTIIVTDNAY